MDILALLPGGMLPILSSRYFSSSLTIYSLIINPVFPEAIASSYFSSADSLDTILPSMIFPSISIASLLIGTLGSQGNVNTNSTGDSPLFSKTSSI